MTLYAVSHNPSTATQISRRLRLPWFLRSGVDTIHLFLNLFAYFAGQFTQRPAVHVSWMRQIRRKLTPNPAGMGVQHNHSIGEANGFADAVRDEQNRFLGLAPDVL